MSQLVPLSKGLFAIVDDDDFARVSAFKWHARTSAPNKPVYAARGIPPYGSTPKLLMHRWLLDAPADMLVDHRNRNGLDNRRENLRLCTTSQNAINRRRVFRSKTSTYVGVHFHKASNKWLARVDVAGSTNHIGIFSDESEAARAYDRAALIHHGEFAVTNFPKEEYA